MHEYAYIKCDALSRNFKIAARDSVSLLQVAGLKANGGTRGRTSGSVHRNPVPHILLLLVPSIFVVGVVGFPLCVAVNKYLVVTAEVL